MTGTALLLVLGSSLLSVLAFAPHWGDSRYGSFRDFYNQVEIGMTRQDVMQAMGRVYPKEGRRNPPMVVTDTQNELGFLMDAEGSNGPDCEGIYVDFLDDKVAHKHYARD